MVEISIRKKLRGPEGPMKLDFRCKCDSGVFMSIFGKSGSGKTSILRMICGLMQPDEGLIKFNNTTWFNSKAGINLKPQLRDVGIVFQDYGLFPNMTVEQNLRFAMKQNGKSKSVDAMLSSMSLQNLANEKPHSLSGGQQQRVALARTLMQNPSLLLLDEPLGAIDLEMRLVLQDEIKRIHTENKLTTLLVSHDRDEVLRLADYIFLIEDGKCIQTGSPIDIFYKPSLTQEGNIRLLVLDVIYEKTEAFALVKVNQEIVKIKIRQDEVKVNKGDYISMKLDQQS